MQNDTLVLDFEYFVNLFEEYYLSDDPGALGNFINGKLEFEDGDGLSDPEEVEDEEEEDPGAVDRKVASSTSIHSMDDDLRDGNVKNGNMSKSRPKSGSTIRLHESGKDGYNIFQCCCVS